MHRNNSSRHHIPLALVRMVEGAAFTNRTARNGMQWHEHGISATWNQFLVVAYPHPMHF
jgi:hypothetical protein